MEQHSQQMEKIFKDAFEKYTMEPSPKVLRRIRYELWKKDFVSVKPNKFNIVYSTLILGSAISFCILSTKPGLFRKDSNLKDQSTVDMKEVSSIEKPAVSISSKVDEKTISTATASEMMLSASFDADDATGCVPHTVHFKNNSVRAISYNWEFGDGNKSNYKDPIYTYTKPGEYQAVLTVKSKEGYMDNFTREIKVLKKPEAAIDIDIAKSEISSKQIVFKNLSKEAKSYKWDFGDHSKSPEKEAAHKYSDFGTYNVTLVAENEEGCTDTAKINNHFIDKNYELAFPFSFKPNSSDAGNNGFYGSADAEGFVFYPKNYGTKIYELKIFAPNGMEVFNTTNIQQGWNGYIKGRLAPAGIYNYSVKGIYPNGKPFDLKGTFKVIIEDFDMN